MLSYDCNVTYTRPWNNNDMGNINQIWSQFLDIHEECMNETNAFNGRRRRLVRVNDDENESVHKYDDYVNEAFKTLKRVSLFIIVSWGWLYL